MADGFDDSVQKAQAAGRELEKDPYLPKNTHTTVPFITQTHTHTHTVTHTHTHTRSHTHTVTHTHTHTHTGTLPLRSNNGIVHRSEGSNAWLNPVTFQFETIGSCGSCGPLHRRKNWPGNRLHGCMARRSSGTSSRSAARGGHPTQDSAAGGVAKQQVAVSLPSSAETSRGAFGRQFATHHGGHCAG